MVIPSNQIAWDEPLSVRSCGRGAEDGLPLVLDVAAYRTQPAADVTTRFLAAALIERVIP